MPLLSFLNSARSIVPPESDFIVASHVFLRTYIPMLINAPPPERPDL